MYIYTRNLCLLLTVYIKYMHMHSSKCSLKPLSVVFKMFQSTQICIHQASALFLSGINSVKNMRDNYKELVKSANQLCLKWEYNFRMKPNTKYILKIFW